MYVKFFVGGYFSQTAQPISMSDNMPFLCNNDLLLLKMPCQQIKEMTQWYRDKKNASVTA